jgi:hypothetical protein
VLDLSSKPTMALEAVGCSSCFGSDFAWEPRVVVRTASIDYLATTVEFAIDCSSQMVCLVKVD